MKQTSESLRYFGTRESDRTNHSFMFFFFQPAQAQTVCKLKWLSGCRT